MVVAFAVAVASGYLGDDQKLAPVARKGAFKFSRLDVPAIQTGKAHVIVEGLQCGRETNYLIVLLIALLQHCRGIAAGYFDSAAGCMGIKSREELLPVRITDELQGLREFRPVVTDAQNHILVGY